jgi:hypothetical protein
VNLKSLLVLALLAACNKGGDTDTDETSDTDDTDTEDTDDTGPDGLSIAGVWDDENGGVQEINDTIWNMGFAKFAIDHYGETFVIAQNDAQNHDDPGLWSRFDWKLDGPQEYFCQTARNATDAAAAEAIAPADATNLETGCGGGRWTTLREHLDAGGDWNDMYGTYIHGNAFVWADTYASYTLTRHDDVAHFFVGQNAPTNTYNPDLWSRFDWRVQDNVLWYCQTAYAAADEATALATAAADSTDPSTGGCGGSPWTAARHLLPIDGTWTDTAGSTHVIDSWSWVTNGSTTFHISKSGPSWVVAQNDASNAYNPELWSRFDWSMAMDGTGAYVCQTAFDAADAAAAEATPPADPTQLDDGCGGSAWTFMSPVGDR